MFRKISIGEEKEDRVNLKSSKESFVFDLWNLFVKLSSESNVNRSRAIIKSLPYSRPIKIEDFSEHYRTMSADSDFRFSEEFEELKHVGRDQPCTAADLPCNRPKNRFTNILPYDHSRFKLQPVDDEEGSDYINANYVPVSLNFSVAFGILKFKGFTRLGRLSMKIVFKNTMAYK